MTLTLLLDLDDTLLGTNLEEFVPAYFRSLAGHLAPHVAPDVMLGALASGTRAMLASRDPAHTLRQVFDREFFPRLGVVRDALQPVIEQYYQQIFPSLGALTKPYPEAVRLIEWALEQGHRVAIATDPVFPLNATHHRLRFAGLAPERYPFALVSSYETFHFTKSFPAFYAEFLGQLGMPDGPILMVGNDLHRDLGPAGALGLATYLIDDGRTAAFDGPHGSLADLRTWLETVDPATLEPRFETREALRALLAAAPASLSAFMDALPAGSWKRRPAASDWALSEVLWHLRDTELELNLPRLERILAEDSPFVSAPDTNAWAEDRDYLQQEAGAAWNDFLAARLTLLERLTGITDAEWSRPARHAIFGPTSLQELVGFMAQHDRLHIQQTWKIVQRARAGL